MTTSAAVGKSGAGVATSLAILLASYAALGPLSLDIYLPAVGALSTELHASPQQATSSLSIFFIGMALGQLFVGPWSDRVGRRLPLLMGLMLAIGGTSICALAPSMPVLLFGRLIQALGGASVMVTGRATIRDHMDERGAASFFSMTATINSLAPMLAPLLGAAVLTVSGWRGIFVLTASLSLALLVATMRLLPRDRGAHTAEPPQPFLKGYATLLRHRQFLGFLFTAGANGASYFTYMALSPLVLMQVYKLTPTVYSLVLGLTGVSLIIAAQVNRRLLRSHTPREILGWAATSSLVLTVPMAVWAFTGIGGLPVLILLIFLVMSSSAFVQANSIAAGLSVVPKAAGSAAALFGAALFGSGTLSSFLGGLFFDGTSRSMTLLMAAALLVMTLALRLLALRPEPNAVAV